MSFEPQAVIMYYLVSTKKGHFAEGKSIELCKCGLYFMYPIKRSFFYKNCFLDFLWRLVIIWKKCHYFPTKWGIYWKLTCGFPHKNIIQRVHIFMSKVSTDWTVVYLQVTEVLCQTIITGHKTYLATYSLYPAGVQDMSIIIYAFKVSIEQYWSWPCQSYL